jgi:hypothetical protein
MILESCLLHDTVFNSIHALLCWFYLNWMIFSLELLKSAFEAFLPNPLLIRWYILDITDQCLLVGMLLYGHIMYYPFKYKWQATLFKDPVRNAQ